MRTQCGHEVQKNHRPFEWVHPLALGQAAFTMIELLVVVALIALVSAFAIPSISSYFKASLNTATREVAGVFREAYNSTLVTGQVHRMVYNFENQEYWVESGPTEVLLDTEATLEKEKDRKRFAKKSTAEPKSKFQLDESVTRKKIALPRGVIFEDLQTEHYAEPVSDGIAYTHIFANGLTERTLIHLKDLQENRITLELMPLVGRTRLLNGYVKMSELAEERGKK